MQGAVAEAGVGRGGGGGGGGGGVERSSVQVSNGNYASHNVKIRDVTGSRVTQGHAHMKEAFGRHSNMKYRFSVPGISHAPYLSSEVFLRGSEFVRFRSQADDGDESRRRAAALVRAASVRVSS
ncbi:hypothetical protein HF521_013244 [Silurus meridionalis]|uniref:Uncharacterized protein n=1 Tax=Silurus meridionalis TaxID=175797 RepID=A0A8T0ABA0_SILME|nr:hypothetical protein HF521_013244 [Silurus meridionalis]